MSNIKFIAVAGNIGSGKSSLVQFLANQYKIVPVFEPNENNPYLRDFYRNMRFFSFHSQMFFLIHKFDIHKKLESGDGVFILDRTIYEDAEIFATHLNQSNIMSKRDFLVYWKFYESICTSLRSPDLMIYLKCSIENSKKRIALRGRSYEKSLPLSYLQSLQTLYDSWVSRYNKSEVIEINTDKFDYITDLIDRIDIMRKIGKYFS